MIDYIKIGKTEYPVRFGINALRVYSGEYDVPIVELGRIDKKTNLFKLMGLLLAGLKDGARTEKKEFPFTVEDISDWADEDTTLLERMLNIYRKQYVGNPPTPGKAGI